MQHLRQLQPVHATHSDFQLTTHITVLQVAGAGLYAIYKRTHVLYTDQQCIGKARKV